MGVGKLQPYQIERAKRFSAEVVHFAQLAERKTGIPACLTLAQWADESAFGRALAAKNNPFGIKWHEGCKFPPGGVVATNEVEHGKTVNRPTRFIAFPTLEDAFIYHGQMIANPHGYYTAALPYIHDWKQFVPKVAHVYATNPQYGQDLLDLINKYHLEDFNLPKEA